MLKQALTATLRVAKNNIAREHKQCPTVSKSTNATQPAMKSITYNIITYDRLQNNLHKQMVKQLNFAMTYNKSKFN